MKPIGVVGTTALLSASRINFPAQSTARTPKKKPPKQEQPAKPEKQQRRSLYPTETETTKQSLNSTPSSNSNRNRSNARSSKPRASRNNNRNHSSNYKRRRLTSSSGPSSKQTTKTSSRNSSTNNRPVRQRTGSGWRLHPQAAGQAQRNVSSGKRGKNRTKQATTMPAGQLWISSRSKRRKASSKVTGSSTVRITGSPSTAIGDNAAATTAIAFPTTATMAISVRVTSSAFTAPVVIVGGYCLLLPVRRLLVQFR